MNAPGKMVGIWEGLGSLESWESYTDFGSQKARKVWNAGKVGMTLEVWKAGKLGNVRKTLRSGWLGKPGELKKLG